MDIFGRILLGIGLLYGITILTIMTGMALYKNERRDDDDIYPRNSEHCE